eukprot:scaffold14500_cov73-Phaeocystis_antarctica.AAC.2
MAESCVPSHRYHPVGFSYIAGGAHTSCKDAAGVAGECPELGGETPTTIQYYVGGAAVTTDESGFGLDAYEPEFFNSQDWWGEAPTRAGANAYKVTLNIPATATYNKIYYFCHIHAGMSAEIMITGTAGTGLNVAGTTETQATALAIYDGIKSGHQKSIATFDQACGTYDVAAFDPSSKHSTCAGKNFLCGEGAGDHYSKCLQAVDCKMHHDMAVSVAVGASKFATFARQMIPHHQNAVAMTKVLLKHHTAADYAAPSGEDNDHAAAEGLGREIINVQNAQIQQMSGWLDGNGGLAKASSQCYADSPIGAVATTSVHSHAVSPGTMQSGVPCTPATTTLAMKWNSHASEWGAYTITGCTGVNPKLTLAAGTTYTFDQSDASNWYHPVGFSYIAGGAHTSCMDSTGAAGECPELGGETPTTIQYHVNDAAVTTDESGFGLDAYEPLFFNSQDWWGAQKAFKVTLTIPTTALYTKIYYFCHIHAGMSAEIEITGSTGGTVLNPATLGMESQASAQAIFTGILAAEQKTVSTHDQACGTYNTYAADTKSSCTNSHFLCGDGARGDYETCLGAIDCQMHHDMAVSVPAGASKFATFARQMIPHHQNAVSMAKSLIKFHTAADYAAPAGEEDDHAAAEGLARNIINVQNAQIQMLAGWLEANPGLAGHSHKCYDQAEGATCTGGKHECAAGTHCECGGHSRRHLLFASMGHKSCKCHRD